MTLSLSVSTNPLINRVADLEELARICAEDIGTRRIQLTHEFINPAWGGVITARLTDRFARAADRHALRASSVMTGAQGRLNNMGHPEAEVRDWTVTWMGGLARIAADLGAWGAGSQFAILTWADWDDPERRASLLSAALDGWSRVWDMAEPLGLRCLFWEPMSVGRELGHTIAETVALNDRIKARGLPLRLCLDVDHGDVSSPDPADTDPYAWITALAADAPIIHVKQSGANKGGHWPFIEPYNSQGRIRAEPLATALRAHGPDKMELCLELSFREREPSDRQVIAGLAASVDWWRPWVDGMTG